MAVVSYRQLILALFAVVSADFGRDLCRVSRLLHFSLWLGPIDRHRRQQADGSDRNNQQRPLQGQAAGAQSRGFYNSPEFKPPALSGEKPVGWFDTKYPNWLSNQDSQLNADERTEGKNGAPSR